MSGLYCFPPFAVVAVGFFFSAKTFAAADSLAGCHSLLLASAALLGLCGALRRVNYDVKVPFPVVVVTRKEVLRWPAETVLNPFT